MRRIDFMYFLAMTPVMPAGFLVHSICRPGRIYLAIYTFSLIVDGSIWQEKAMVKTVNTPVSASVCPADAPTPAAAGASALHRLGSLCG